jgi:predicted dehydrogenase
MSEKNLRIGVIGAGDNTRKRHIPNLQAIDGVELAAVCNRSRASGQRVAEQFGIDRVCDHWRQITDDPQLDAVVIGTWPYLHCRATLAALEAEKHVMTEARMAADAAEARAMRNAAQRRPNLVAQVVPSPFTLDRDATIQRLITEGYLGDLLVVEHRMGFGPHDREGGLTLRRDMDLSGVNVMALGIWYEAIMRWVGEATRVTAMGKRFQTLRADAEGVARPARVPEHVDVTAEMACGAQLHMQQSQATFYMEGTGCYIVGSEGVLHVNGKQLRGAKRGEDALQPIEIPEQEAGGWRVEEEFVGAIRGEESIRRTTFEDGVKYMEFTEAVARSMASGRAVSLPLKLDG